MRGCIFKLVDERFYAKKGNNCFTNIPINLPELYANPDMAVSKEAQF